MGWELAAIGRCVRRAPRRLSPRHGAHVRPRGARYFDEDSQIEERLGAIDRAVCLALDRPIYGARETFNTDDAPNAERRALPSVGGVSPKWWEHIEADPVTGAAMEDDAEASESEGREAAEHANLCALAIRLSRAA